MACLFFMDLFYPNTDYWHGRVSQKVIERDGYKCIQCHSDKDLLIHHIIPISKGGKSTMGNQQLLCRSCHSKLHNSKKTVTKIALYLREWTKKHPDYMTNYMREWRKRHPGYFRKYIDREKYMKYKN